MNHEKSTNLGLTPLAFLGARPSWDNYAGILRFTNMPNWLEPIDLNPAMSLGSVNVYNERVSPKDPNRFGVNTEREESLHTIQSRWLGPLYFPLHGIAIGASILTSGDTHDNNFLEKGPERGFSPWPQ